jgi:hypothetical protein
MLLTGLGAWAQEKHHFSFQVPAEYTKYVQQHTIDVGDVPGHQTRIFEIKRTYAKGMGNFDGVDITEEWNRGYSDYVNGSGRNWGYVIWVLESGDKVFGRFDATSQKVLAADGSASASGIAVTNIVGGTGRFAKIRGTALLSYTFDAARGINATKVAGDYWMEQ